MWNRRQFIKTLGVLGGAVVAPFHWLGRAQASSLPDTPLPPGAELYEGFLLLPEDAPVPPWVKPPKLGPPIVCGVGQDQGVSNLVGVTEVVETAEELAKAVGFPIYNFSRVPDGFRLVGGSVLRHNTGEVYDASLGFEVYSPEIGSWETAVTLGAQPDFARPLPLWSSQPVDHHKDRAIVLEKVSSLPSLGIMVVTRRGYIFQWIENDILYILVAEHSKHLEDAQELVSSLLMVGR